MIVCLIKKATKEDFDKAKETFGEYIKIVIDLEKEILLMGMKIHADGEKILLEKGSKNKDLWGGGIDLSSKQIDCQAVLNIRPNLSNDNMEILDPKIRQKFLKIAKKYLI